VIASASDHFTRVFVNGGNLSGSSAVIGLLFGSIHDNVMAINDATDVLVDTQNNIAEPEVEKKRQLWTAVYPTYQLLGWYAFHDSVVPQHLAIHKTLEKFTPKPVFILFDPKQQQHETQLDRIPLTAYFLESPDAGKAGNEYKSSGNNLIFLEKNYLIESTDVEKLALDEITKSIPLLENSNKLMNHNGMILTSLSLLEQKIQKILEVLKKMEKGEIPKNSKLLQSAVKISDSLTSLQSKEYAAAFQEDLNDSTLSVYLSTVLKGFQNLSEMNEVTALVSENRGGKSIV
jgi:COP9 signalosome complex subunit 6